MALRRLAIGPTRLWLADSFGLSSRLVASTAPTRRKSKRARAKPEGTGSPSLNLAVEDITAKFGDHDTPIRERSIPVPSRAPRTTVAFLDSTAATLRGLAADVLTTAMLRAAGPSSQASTAAVLTSSLVDDVRRCVAAAHISGGVTVEVRRATGTLAAALLGVLQKTSDPPSLLPLVGTVQSLGDLVWADSLPQGAGGEMSEVAAVESALGEFHQPEVIAGTAAIHSLWRLVGADPAFDEASSVAVATFASCAAECGGSSVALLLLANAVLTRGDTAKGVALGRVVCPPLAREARATVQRETSALSSDVVVVGVSAVWVLVRIGQALTSVQRAVMPHCLHSRVELAGARVAKLLSVGHSRLPVAAAAARPLSEATKLAINRFALVWTPVATCPNTHVQRIAMRLAHDVTSFDVHTVDAASSGIGAATRFLVSIFRCSARDVVAIDGFGLSRSVLSPQPRVVSFAHEALRWRVEWIQREAEANALHPTRVLSTAVGELSRDLTAMLRLCFVRLANHVPLDGNVTFLAESLSWCFAQAFPSPWDAEDAAAQWCDDAACALHVAVTTYEFLTNCVQQQGVDPNVSPVAIIALDRLSEQLATALADMADEAAAAAPRGNNPIRGAPFAVAVRVLARLVRPHKLSLRVLAALVAANSPRSVGLERQPEAVSEDVADEEEDEEQIDDDAWCKVWRSPDFPTHGGKAPGVEASTLAETVAAAAATHTASKQVVKQALALWRLLAAWQRWVEMAENEALVPPPPTSDKAHHTTTTPTRNDAAPPLPPLCEIGSVIVALEALLAATHPPAVRALLRLGGRVLRTDAALLATPYAKELFRAVSGWQIAVSYLLVNRSGDLVRGGDADSSSDAAGGGRGAMKLLQPSTADASGGVDAPDDTNGDVDDGVASAAVSTCPDPWDTFAQALIPAIGVWLETLARVCDPSPFSERTRMNDILHRDVVAFLGKTAYAIVIGTHPVSGLPVHCPVATVVLRTVLLNSEPALCTLFAHPPKPRLRPVILRALRICRLNMCAPRQLPGAVAHSATTDLCVLLETMAMTNDTDGAAQKRNLTTAAEFEAAAALGGLRASVARRTRRAVGFSVLHATRAETLRRALSRDHPTLVPPVEDTAWVPKNQPRFSAKASLREQSWDAGTSGKPASTTEAAGAAAPPSSADAEQDLDAALSDLASLL